MARLNLYSRLGAPAIFDPAHKYVTSPVFRSPLVLASLRITIALYTLVVLLVTLIWKTTKQHDGKSYFSFFTYLTYIGLCAYYFTSSTQTFSYALRWRKSGAGAGYPLQHWPRFLQALHVILQSTVVTFPIIVTVVFWVLLADPTTFGDLFSSWSNISIHALNTLFALIEILLTNSPPAPWLTLIPCLLFMVGYLGVAYITHATQGIYTYSFLDPHKQGAKLAAYIVGIAVGEIIVFSLVRGIVVLRERWAVKTGRVLLAQEGGSEGNGDDWEEVESPTTAQKTSDV